VFLKVLDRAMSRWAGVDLRARAPGPEEKAKVCAANVPVGVQVGRDIGLTPRSEQATQVSAIYETIAGEISRAGETLIRQAVEVGIHARSVQ
jgi:hypothetical protein